MTWSTADLHDAHPDAVQVLDVAWHSFGLHQSFAGPISTLLVFEDHRPVLAALGEPGKGRVLVVDGQGSARIGLMGDRLAGIAVTNGWAGVVLNGVIRDGSVIDGLALGVRALGTTARRAEQPGPDRSARDTVLGFGGAILRPGDHLYADGDAVLIASRQLTP